MEKQTDVTINNSRYAPTRRTRGTSRSRWSFLTALFILTIYTLRPRHGTWFPLDSDAPPNHKSTEWFIWDDLPAKPYLDYVDCYDGEFQCARIELPMDYWNGTTDAKIGLAVIRKPAVIPVTHPQYGGAILYNPGGPGGSGVGLMLGAARELGEVVDSADGKYFDAISFDPRGVGASTPFVQCFEDAMFDQAWMLREMEQGVFSSSDAALGRLWSMRKARGNSCSLPPSWGEIDIKKYVSTASVARDMLELVERHGEWREKEAKRLLQQQGRCLSSSSAELTGETLDVLKALKYKRGEEKINYWGFSYGSYLGNTFAAMFPDRVNRLIVDGVVDAYDYEKTLWLDNLVDTEKALDLFYYHCARVGFPLCALGNETGPTTADGLKQEWRNITNSLYHNPLPVISSEGPEVITYSDIKSITLGVLYSPLFGFPFLAKMLADIERGDGSELAEMLRWVHSFYCPTTTASTVSMLPLRSRSRIGPVGLSMDTTMAIACGDGDDQSWVTKPMFEEHVKNLTKLSPSVGEIWGALRMTCIHYNTRAVHRFEGPWVGNTSHPILEIGNSADPVTPGRYAKKMAKGFTGAVALIQDSAGHCSLSTPSICTMLYVRQYFQTGELPPEGTICKADAVPFGPSPGDFEVLDQETKSMGKRQARIAKAVYAAGGGYLNGHLGVRMSKLMEDDLLW